MSTDVASILSFFASMGIGIAALYCMVGPTSFTHLRNKLAYQAEVDGLEDVYFCKFALVPTCGIAAITSNSGHFSILIFASITMLHRYILLLMFSGLPEQMEQLPLRVHHWKLDLFDAIALTVPAMLSAAIAYILMALVNN